MAKNYLITGGAGFIGSNYADHLLGRGAEVTIFDNFSGYKLVDERTGEVLDDVSTSAAIRKNVRGFWLALEQPHALAIHGWQVGLRVLEQFIRIGSPFILPCDRHDVATLTQPASVYLYETVPGGIGIAEKMVDVWL